MALSDLVLPAGKIIIIKSDSIVGLSANGVGLNFGVVQMVNDLCDVTTVGDSVWIDMTNAVPFMLISGQTYYMVDEKNIISGETLAP